MAKTARKAAHRNLENVLFVQAAVEKLPPELAGVAGRITINYPWGSLLRAVAVPDTEVLSNIAALGGDGASLTLLVNMSVFDQPAYCAKLDLPCPPVLDDPEKTRWFFRRAGLEVTRIVSEVKEAPYKTTWGQKLTKGSRRRVLRLDAVVGSRPLTPAGAP